MNNKTLTIIGIVVIILLAIYFFYNKAKNLNREGGTETGSNGGTNTGTGTSSSTSATSTPTSSNTGTGTPTSTGTGTGTPLQPGQILITKPVIAYYRRGTPANPPTTPTQTYGYPFYYQGPVAGMTFQPGKVLTIVGVPLQSGSGLGLMLQTTEPTISLPPQYDTVLFIRQSDL